MIVLWLIAVAWVAAALTLACIVGAIVRLAEPRDPEPRHKETDERLGTYL